MQILVDLISQQVADAFEAAGFDRSFGKATLSNRPDLCEFQCNGAMPAAKTYHKAPIQIASAVCEKLADFQMFESRRGREPRLSKPELSGEYLAQFLRQMQASDRFGVEPDANARTIVIDYGGPNVAKPLHVGHLRSAIIGESVKRIYRYLRQPRHRRHPPRRLGPPDGPDHRGGAVERHPELPYFDPDFTGEYPEGSAVYDLGAGGDLSRGQRPSKADEAFAARAHHATYLLQSGDRGYRAMWEHIMRVSVADLKRNYENLNVSFDVWLGESDAQKYIPQMLDIVKGKGLTVESEGALVVPVQEESDTKEIPPCILLKSDGATLYATTDLATIVQREQDFHPGKILYVVDKRQSLHFEQVFRVARKAELVPADDGACSTSASAR